MLRLAHGDNLPRNVQHENTTRYIKRPSHLLDRVRNSEIAEPTRITPYFVSEWPEPLTENMLPFGRRDAQAVSRVEHKLDIQSWKWHLIGQSSFSASCKSDGKSDRALWTRACPM